MLADWQARVGEAEAKDSRLCDDRRSHLHHLIEAELTGPFVVPKYDLGPPDEEKFPDFGRKRRMRCAKSRRSLPLRLLVSGISKA